jgi:hypothetical protein
VKLVSLPIIVEGSAIMPRFYFHLRAPDQVFADNMGSDLSDLSAAHTRALLLADRVMMIFGFADRTSDFRRWTVDVTDDKQRSLITVKFPINFPRGKRKAVAGRGIRPLLQRLDATMRASPQLRPSGSEESPPAPRVKAKRPERGQVRTH